MRLLGGGQDRFAHRCVNRRRALAVGRDLGQFRLERIEEVLVGRAFGRQAHVLRGKERFQGDLRGGQLLLVGQLRGGDFRQHLNGRTLEP
ncbi:MAG TPA: hypothetical protein VFI31_16850, partial [Pirellulales bacterium]|nr:hypothetical protein [Pirellulales bacterium]